MATKLTKGHFYVLYHILLLCFIMYLTVQINSVIPQGYSRQESKFGNSNTQTFLDKLRLVAEGGGDISENEEEYNQKDERTEKIRVRRNTGIFENLTRGLFSNFVNRSYAIRHEQWIEEIMPSLIALENIVIREAQKTKLAFQRVNIKLRELEAAVQGLATSSISDTTTEADTDTFTTLEPELMALTNTSEAYNTTDEMESSGDVEGLDYVTALPASYNDTQNYVFDMNNLLKPLYIIIEELEHKVSEQKAYAARTEVNQKNMQTSLYHLEDTINDEQRKLRQLATESSHHRSRMASIENLINTLDGTEIRVNARINRLEDEQADLFDMIDEHGENFRDMKRSIYKATQTVKDLEGADTVHERDTRTLQQNLSRLQQLMTRIYGTVDSSVHDLRDEIKGDLSRLCFNNKQLVC
ncbi:hypothetical protein LOTGIDRAFT_159058 [Lottia gigantea]|uniref:Uncharacterized protein n=1 Tax=Lottia gigantea TaxID=225164 RepID=V4AM88_LOTGI|nr:hypothetical protein LOTGIDRAFT_159058 [Lottia gigantea]ESO98262.1 hypothetical protein LOTGIDRAFT_159058 [Lottia gigantea]